MTFFTKC